MGKFGWSLPPGVTNSMIDPGEPPCELCGHGAEDCICPECPVCGTQGDPNCYREGPEGHDMERTAAQQIEYQKFRVAEAKAIWQEECQILDYLEEQASDYKENSK